METIETDIPGKFDATEEAVLEYLYVHPGRVVGTEDLIREIKPDPGTTEQRQYTYDEIQGAIETLIADKIARGKRVSVSGRVSFEKLSLTRRGEVAAIRERKREKKLVVSISVIGRDK